MSVHIHVILRTTKDNSLSYLTVLLKYHIQYQKNSTNICNSETKILNFLPDVQITAAGGEQIFRNMYIYGHNIFRPANRLKR